MDDRRRAEIEEKAHELLALIWERQGELWPLGVPALQRLDPAAGAKVLGIAFYDNVPLMALDNARSQLAGIIDRQAKKIAVSCVFDSVTRRFTAAHELGHYLLHTGKTMHRDIAPPAMGQRRDVYETEANHFAACFLMPRKLIHKHFRERFGSETPFVFTDASAFFLRPSNPHSLLYADLREQTKALATATTYAGQHFVSLAEEFHVSPSAMAIRIEELGLVKYE